MRIALDATYSVGDELSGVGLYSREMLNGLAAARPAVGFDFYYRPHRYWRSRAERLPVNARRRLLIEPLGPRSADLVHGLNQRLPRMPLRRAVTTFHDLFVLTGEYSTPEFRARFAAQARDAAARSSLIIAVSAFTGSQVMALLGVEPDRVRVIHHGVRELAYPAGRAARERDPERGGDPEAQEHRAPGGGLRERWSRDWRLVLAGSRGYGSEEIMARIAASPARDRISVLGYVSHEDLAGWYARARIFAFPSLDEGFGMPVLEAMAAGTPVVTSNRSALPEVAGDAAILVDPEDTQALARALRSLSEDEMLWRDMSWRGAARAHLFTWDEAVRKTWQVYREVLG